MIVYRSGQIFCIDASGASAQAAKARFAQMQADRGSARGVAARLELVTLDYRRWWAEQQPEVRWAEAEARGAYVVDVSQTHWREKGFLLTFELTEDAKQFALLFLGLDQAACDALITSGA